MNIHTFQTRSRVPQLLAMAAVAFSVPAVATSTASAGEYHFFGCQDFAGNKLSTEDFKFQSSGGLGHGANTCATNGYLTLALPLADMVAGQWTGYGLKVPDGSGLRLKFVKFNRQVQIGGGTDVDNGATAAYKFEYGTEPSSTFGVATSREEWCEYDAGCRGMGWPGVNGGTSESAAGFLGGGATFIGISLECRSKPGWVNGRCSGSGGSSLPRAKTLLSWMDLTVTDNGLPTVGAPGGSLLADGARKGTEKLSLAAVDAGSGVFDAVLKIDGAVAQTIKPQGSPASCVDGGNVAGNDFARIQPCLTTAAVEFSVNTALYGEGKHTVSALVRDAAGNASSEITRDIVIDNIPAPALAGAGPESVPRLDGNSQVGQTLTAFDGRWTGSGVALSRQWQVSEDGETWKGVGATAATWRPEAGHAGKLVRVLVTASNGEGSAQAASAARRVEAGSGAGGGVIVGGPGELATLTPDNGEGGKAASGRLVASSKSEKIRTGYKKLTRVRGQLLDEAGTPITGADIDVYEKVITSRSERRKVATIKTDAKGAYVYESRPTSSRTAELAYSRQRGSATYQSTHAVRLQVQAGVQVSLSRGWVPSQGLVTLKGRVLASDLPKNGVMVQVQARDRGKWIAAGLTRTKQNGRFTWKYRLRATSGQIPFRAVLRRTGDLPATVNTSRAVKVRIG